MAHIPYLDPGDIPERHRVKDQDNIIRVHGVHGRMMRLHNDLYVALMHRPGPLSRRQREMIAVAVSGINRCHY